jgi:hypothetical protein
MFPPIPRSSSIQQRESLGRSMSSTDDSPFTSVEHLLDYFSSYISFKRLCFGTGECLWCFTEEERRSAHESPWSHFYQTCVRCTLKYITYRMKNASPLPSPLLKSMALARVLTYPRLPYYLARFINNLWAVGPLGPNILLLFLLMFTSFYCWINKYQYRPPFCTSYSSHACTHCSLTFIYRWESPSITESRMDSRRSSSISLVSILRRT